MAAWKSRHMLHSVAPRLSCFLTAAPHTHPHDSLSHLTNGQTELGPGGPAALSFSSNLFSLRRVRAPCALFPPSSFSPSLLSSPCVCLCSSPCSCLIFLETNYRALQEGKKKQGEQFGQRASRFLLPHFHEDHVFSLQVLFFSLTSLSLFHSLYICLCPSLIYILLSAPLLLHLSNLLYDLIPSNFFSFGLRTRALKISSLLYSNYQTECCICACLPSLFACVGLSDQSR